MSYKCCLCGKMFSDYGNNPWPLKEEGKCCNKCNMLKVIPERFKMIYINKES